VSQLVQPSRERDEMGMKTSFLFFNPDKLLPLHFHVSSICYFLFAIIIIFLGIKVDLKKKFVELYIRLIFSRKKMVVNK